MNQYSLVLVEDEQLNTKLTIITVMKNLSSLRTLRLRCLL